MARWIFIEDKDIESGHGWRYGNYRLLLSPYGNSEDPDRDIVAQILDEDGEAYSKYSGLRYASCSYAWLTPEDYWNQHHRLQDNIRINHVLADYPSFRGVNTMESHFEFRMTPKEMRAYLIGLGMVEVIRN